MDKKIRNIVIFSCVYLLIFWIGFKSGAAYLRMQNKIRVEKIEIPEPPPPVFYYVVEKNNYGSYSNVNIVEVKKDNTLMKIFFNDKLRPLLKTRDIEIYTMDGDRIY